MQDAVNRLVKHHFPVAPAAEVLIICDTEKHPFAVAAAEAYREAGCLPTLVCFPANLKPESPLLRYLLEDSEADLLLLPSADMWSSQHMWTYLDFTALPPRLKGKGRHFKLELMPLPSILRLYGSDPDSDHEYLQGLKSRLPDHQPMLVTAPGGTKLHFVSRTWVIHGWEVLTAPVEQSVDGHIVVDGSLFFAEIDHPIQIDIKQGKINSITGTDKGNDLLEKYREFTRTDFAVEANRQLAEIGIGGNAKAQFSGIIMEDETIRNTCHFCFGNNSPFGGDNLSDWHGGTVVIRNPVFSVL